LISLITIPCGSWLSDQPAVPAAIDPNGMRPVGPSASDFRYPISARQTFLLTLTPPPTTTCTSTHPAQPTLAQASCAANLASIATNRAWSKAFLAWSNAFRAWVTVNRARSMVFQARVKAFQLSGTASEARSETNQAWIVAYGASDGSSHMGLRTTPLGAGLCQTGPRMPYPGPRMPHPGPRMPHPGAPNALTRFSNALLEASDATTQAPNALPQVSSARALVSCGTTEGRVPSRPGQVITLEVRQEGNSWVYLDWKEPMEGGQVRPTNFSAAIGKVATGPTLACRSIARSLSTARIPASSTNIA
jgi:hypothetical protein